MSRIFQYAIGIILFASTNLVLAEHLIMSRVKQTFPETMLMLQNTIKQKGYTVSRVQRVDIGLTNSGYKTDKYRLVFFGKAAENHRIAEKYPFLAAYLPLKIAIFAEGQETLLVAFDPVQLFGITDKDLASTLQRWQHDIHAILNDVRNKEDN